MLLTIRALSCAMFLLPAAVTAMPVATQSPRDLLTYAAYQDSDVAAALARIDRARAIAQATAARAPDDQDAAVVGAVASAYRAKLTGNRSEAIAARRGLEAVVARFPRNAEAQLGLGAWHLGVIAKVGRLMARAGAGAQKGIGIAAVDRAVALGGSRAVFPGIAGLLLVQSDADDAHGRALIEAAVHGSTGTAIDRINQRAAATVLAALNRNDDKAARALADRLLPFGWVRGK